MVSKKFIKEYLRVAMASDMKEIFQEYFESNFNAKIETQEKGFLLDFDGEKLIVETKVKTKIKNYHK